MRTDYHCDDDELIWRKKFGDKLKRLIHIKGMTQGEFANELGVSEIVLSRYITGIYTPGLYRTKQMARILGCDLNCLFEVDE